MSNLSDIEKQLYSKDPKLEGHSVEPQLKGGVPGANTVQNTWTAPATVGVPGKFKKYALIIGGSLLGLAVLLLAVSYFTLSRSFALDNVKVVILAPAETSSGALVEWRVQIDNRNKIALNGAQLDFEYPEGAFEFSEGLPGVADGRQAARIREQIGVVAARGQYEKIFKARLLGAKEDAKFVKATLTFSPSGLSSRLERTTQTSTRISSVPIALTIQAPNQLLSGEEVFYEIHYFNAGTFAFRDLALRLDFPPDFSFINADPLPTTGEAYWRLESLPGSGQGLVKIHGTLSGDRDEIEALRATIEGVENGTVIKYAQATTATQILGSPLRLSIDLDNDGTNADIGENLNYKITYENTFDVPLEDLTLSATFIGNIFNFNTLQSHGAFDLATSTITWSGFERPDLKLLEPNKSGAVSFNIKLKDRLPIIGPQDQNFTMQLQARLSTQKVPPLIGGAKIERRAALATKINSRLAVQPAVFYRDSSSAIQNFGPLPPRLGETTTFTAHLSIINVSNDAENVVVKAAIPTGVVWTNNFTANFKPEGVSYDPITKIITWNLGRVVATTGIAVATKELVFQISLTPSQANKLNSQELVRDVVVTGTDSFTGVPLRGEGFPLNVSQVTQ